MRSTSLDIDLLVTATGLAGLYVSSSGISFSTIKNNSSMAVDNLDIAGAMSDARQVNFQMYVKPEDIAVGLWDEARVRVFEVDTDDTSQATTLLSGPIGQIKRTFEGEYTAEARNLFQLLNQQQIGETISITCRATLGSGAEVPVIRRCGVDLSSYEVNGAIEVINRDRFDWTDSSLVNPANWFRDGLVRWLTGENAGYVSQIRRHLTGGRIVLDSTTPYPMTVGDTYVLTPGCDHTLPTCRDKFNNVVNFRGEPHLPGIDALIAGEGSE